MNFEEMFGNAEWVTPGSSCKTPYIRKKFSVPHYINAEITVCGLGFYYLFINGKKVSDDLFVTLATDYHDHETVYGEEISHRIVCQKYNVTQYLKAGENAIGFLLGLGYYYYPDRGATTVYGDVKVCYKLDLTDKNGDVHTYCSNGDMRWNKSFVWECENFLVGETQDFNNEEINWCSPEFDDSAWSNVEAVSLPETYYELMTSPADKAFEETKPKLISENEFKSVYDIGKNDAGWAVIRIPQGFYGEALVRFSEEMSGENLDEEKIHNQYFKINNNGEERTTHPFLTWHAFRYAEVQKPAEMVGFIPVHSDISVRADFKSSNSMLNWLTKTFINTVQSNFHCGLLSDCPHIERLGYTGDGQVEAEAVQLFFNAKSFYQKWIKDIFDCQDKKTGHVQYTAPLVPNGGGPGGYGCAIIEVPYMYYKTYGDATFLKEAYQKTKKYFSYLDSHSENNLVISDQPGAWCLGDWCTAQPIKLPEPFVNTYFYIKSLQRMTEVAVVTGNSNEIPIFKKKQRLLEKAITDKYFNPINGNFCDAVQGANAYAVDIGLGNQKTYNQITEFYQNYQMFDTGIFGTEILLRVLFENGDSELAYKLLSSEKEFSFGNWMNKGATTLWEYWTGERSHNHPMFGAAVKYLIKYILGIRQTEKTCGYRSLLINPADISLEQAEGYVDLEIGRVSVCYQKNAKKIKFNICIPDGISAVFSFRKKYFILKAGNNEIII